LNAYLSHKALMLKMAHVVERKKVAFRQKRQANTKIEQQIRLLDKQAVEAHKQLLTDDNPVTCVPNHHAYSAVLISIFRISIFRISFNFNLSHFPRQAWMPIRHKQRNKGMTQEFETLGRTVVATGCSGRHARHTLLLTADYLLHADEAANFAEDLPTTHWFAKQREAVGNESFVYACLQIAVGF
jgi:hypothetical protein